MADYCGCNRGVAEAMLHLREVHKELTIRVAEMHEYGVHDAFGELTLLKNSVVQAARDVITGTHDEAQMTPMTDDELSEEDGVRVVGERLELSHKLTESSRLYRESLGLMDRILCEYNLTISQHTGKPSGDRPAGFLRDPSGEPGYAFPNATHPCNMFSVPLHRRRETFITMCMNFFLGIPMSVALWLALGWMGSGEGGWAAAWWVWCAYNVYMAVDTLLVVRFGDRPRPLWQWWRDLGCWKWMRNYFPVRLRVERPAAFSSDENYVFVLHPHGVHSFGAFINFVTNANKVDQIIPGVRVHVMTLGIQFKLPFWRELAVWGGCGNASRKSIVNCLKGPPGESALLVVGGAEESLLSQPGNFDLVLKKRKGFVKIALQQGAPLVPCFSFGETDVYRALLPRFPYLRPYLKAVQSKFGFALPLIAGRGVFSYRGGLLPHRRQITTVVGDPIPVAKWSKKWDPADPALQRRIDEVHEQYIAALRGLYERNKDIHALSRKGELNLVT